MKFVREFLWERLSIRIAYPTSHVVRICFQRKNDNDRDFLYWVTTLIPVQYHLPLTSIHTYLSVILRIFNSDERIDIEKFTTLCLDTYELIIESFPWASITPTLHKILAHSAQLIDEYNGGRGMKSFSEEGLEACHKYIRRYREQLARKTSFEDNIRDVFYSTSRTIRFLLIVPKKTNWHKNN